MDNNGRRTYRYNKMLKPDNITVLHICQFTVDVTLKYSRLYKSLKNEIHLRSGRNQYSQCLMGCTWNTILRKEYCSHNVRTDDLHDIISSTKLDSP